MRIIAGKAKGKSISAPEGLLTRPTADKAREAIFGSLQFEIPEARVLDIFAGSGAMGVEALSRGAKEAIFIDNSRAACQCIKNNLLSCGFSAKIISKDFISALTELNGEFDFIFADPPYKSGYYQTVVDKIIENKLLKDSGKLVLEHDGSISVTGVKVLKEKRYGKAHVTVCALEENR